MSRPELSRHETLQRLAAVSARPVTRGGESGLWRWLIPILAVAALGLVGQRVLTVAEEAREARDTAALAQALSTDVILSDDRAALRESVKVLRGIEPIDGDVHRLSAELWLPEAERGKDSVRRSTALAKRIDERFDARADDKESSARNGALS